LLEADVEPDRGVERGELVDEDRLQLVIERLCLVLVDEVAAFAAPRADRRDDPADHLPDRELALGRRHPSTEVLLRDDVRRGLRPELRELDPLLVERGLVLARDEGVARLPFDLCERVAAGDREVAANPEGGVLLRDRIDEILRADLYVLFYRRHVP